MVVHGSGVRHYSGQHMHVNGLTDIEITTLLHYYLEKSLQKSDYGHW